MATNLPFCFSIQFLEQLLKFLVNFTLLKYVTSQRSYGYLITKELTFGFQILDLKDHFSASLNSLVVNLSKRTVTGIERSVLKLGLTFCPSQKNFNKEKRSLDYFRFIRRLKLREHFYTNPPCGSTDEHPKDERSELKWKSENSDWYPDEVKYSRREDLLEFIENITNYLKSNLKKNERNFWNNLNNDQRKALLHLSNDGSIII